MKKIILLIFLCINLLYAFEIQRWDYNATNSSYNVTAESAGIEHISSDFGKRYYLSSTGWIYGWHKGIDLEVEFTESDLLLSPFNATVISLYTSNELKYVALESNDGDESKLGFLHIFSDSTFPHNITSGNAIYSLVNDVTEYCIIIINPYNTSDRKAYALTAGLPVTFTYNNEPNPTTINTLNTITTMSPFAPVGNSGGTTHLHISSYRENISNINVPKTNHRNPLEILDIKDESDNNYTNLIDYDFDLEYTPHYDSNPSTIKSRANLLNPDSNPATMTAGNSRFTDAIMCVDRLELLIESSNDESNEFSLIEGNESKSYFSHYARQGELGFYPLDIHNSTQGHATETGIDPYAYRSTGGQGYDDLYYADFYTRIHKDDDITNATVQLADINEEARYPDGQYHVYSHYETVYDEVSEIGTINPRSRDPYPLEITIDNFSPYIKKVEVLSGGESIYFAEWVWDGSVIKLLPALPEEKMTGIAQVVNDLSIIVTASESLSELFISFIPSLNWVGSGISLNNEKTEWGFVITEDYLDDFGNNNGECKIIFSGEDFAGNNIQGFSNPVAINQVLTRVDANNWSHTPIDGNDVVHKFIIGDDSGTILVKDIQDDNILNPGMYPNEIDKYILEDIDNVNENFNFVRSGYTQSVDNEV